MDSRLVDNLTENTKERITLEDAWNIDEKPNGILYRALEEGLWNFAIVAAELEPDDAIEPEFGYSQAYDLPDDYVRKVMISEDEFFSTPCDYYDNEQGIIYSSANTLYMRYVSSTPGLEMGNFPGTYARFVAMLLAEQVVGIIKTSKTADVQQMLKKARTNARSKDAMEQPVEYPRKGRWQRARLNRSSRYDNGKRNQLVG